MIRAKVNDKEQFELKIADKQVELNGKEYALDAWKVEEGAIHLIMEGKSYRTRLMSADRENKTYSIAVNGKTYEVVLNDEIDLLLNRLGLSAHAGKKMNEVKAPMPGLVLKIVGEKGQTVKKGDSLLVLEAMKMENVIKAPGEGVIKAIRVNPGDKVEKNALLVEFE